MDDFDRKTGIGGSDASAALGINPWDSPVTLYLKKIGELPESETKEVMYWGNVLEDIVATEYAKRTGQNVRRRNETLRHKQHDFMYAHLDRSVDGEKKVLECKTAGAWTANEWGEDGTDQVPEQYLIQVHHYMLCAGYKQADLAVLIGGNDFRMYNFEYDEELANIIMEKEYNFWHENVLARVPPEPQTPRDIDALYAIANNETTLAGDEIMDYYNELLRVRSEIKILEEGKSYIEYRIKKDMRHCSALMNEDGEPIITWKQSKDSRVFDPDAFKVEHSDLFAKFKKTRTGSRRFLVKGNSQPYITTEIPNVEKLTKQN